MDGPSPAPGLFPLVGRDTEIDTVTDFLAGRSPAACLVLTGAAGIGKTTLWQHGLELGAHQGLRVVSTRAHEGEAGLLFAALGDLLDGFDAATISTVPPPQRLALDVALRRRDAEPGPVDPFAIASGLLSAVRASAEATPVLIAIDDVQWLDPSSADCLLFLARRASGPRVRFLLSHRRDESSPLEAALQGFGVEQLEIGMLSVGAVARLLSDRLGLALPRRLLHRLYETSQGNPLFALELGRSIHKAGLPGIGADLPLPTVVADAFAARVGDLSDPLRQAVLAVALSTGLARAQLERLVDPLVVEDALDAGLLTVDRSRMRSSHPMLAAAARQQSSATSRRDLHRRLAAVVDDPVLAARHEALATDHAQPEVAGRVAAAARVAIERGATHEAEELAGHALRLTPAGTPEETDRLLALAQCQLTSGDMPGAGALLTGRIDTLPPGRPRAMAHILLGQAGDGLEEERHLDLAIAEIDDDPEFYGMALCRKAVLLAAFRLERLVEAEALAREAQACTEGTVEEIPGRRALAWVQMLRGQPIDHLRQETVEVRPGESLFESIDRQIGIQQAFRGSTDAATETLRVLGARSDELGDPRGLLAMAVQVCEFALRKGDVRAARALLDDVRQWTAIDELKIVEERLLCVLAAVQGIAADALVHGERVVAASADPHVSTWDLLEARRGLGLAALFEGDHPAAVAHLAFVWDHCQREGIDDPGAFPAAGDLVEALVAIASIDAAVRVTSILEELSTAQAHPWGLATVRRARAMIELATHPGGAGDGLMDAADRYGRLGLDFERARSLMYLGRLHRRAKRRGDARQVLDAATTLFDRLGCDGWSASAHAELSRVSGRRPMGEAELTPSERQVAELAVAGLSNKEIAKALYVSVYTVEAHLTHAYAKLGVRSRSQLAGRITPA